MVSVRSGSRSGGKGHRDVRLAPAVRASSAVRVGGGGCDVPRPAYFFGLAGDGWPLTAR